MVATCTASWADLSSLARKWLRQYARTIMCNAYRDDSIHLEASYFSDTNLTILSPVSPTLFLLSNLSCSCILLCVQGAQADSSKPYIQTTRSTNPLNPQYTTLDGYDMDESPPVTPAYDVNPAS